MPDSLPVPTAWESVWTRVKSYRVCGGLRFAQDERSFLSSLLKAFAAGLSGKRVLDMGAGTQQYRALFDHGNSYESCDLERGFHGSARPDIVADIYAIPVESGTFDVVLMTQVLEHLEFPVKGLSEVHRVLRADGVLFLSVPQGAGDHFAPHHYFNYTRYGLRSVLEQAGFEIAEYHRLDGIFVYVANRIAKLGGIIYDQCRERGGFLAKSAALILSKVCCLVGGFVSLFDFLDKTRNYCLGHVVVARKRRPG